MHIYLGLGTNLGDKERNLLTAVDKLEERVGTVVSLSSFHATAPWGFSSEHTFLNAALCLEADRAVAEFPAVEGRLLHILGVTQQIEREMGRMHKSAGGVYSDRLIDIDLLLCLTDDGTSVVLDLPELKLPHPLMWERDFVVRPLAEIMPVEVYNRLKSNR